MREAQAARRFEHKTSRHQLLTGVANPIRLPCEDTGDLVDDERTRGHRERGEQRAGVATQRPEPLADETRPIVGAAASRECLQPEW